MSFKSRKTRWFETYTPRDLTVYAIEALARTGTVELYHDIWSANTRDTDYIRSVINDFLRLAQKFEKDLPTSLRPPKTQAVSPEHLAESALKTLRKWGADLFRLKRNAVRTAGEIEQLEQLKELLLAIPDHDLDFKWIDQQSHVLYKKIFYCPAGEFKPPSGQKTVVKIFPGEKQDFILLIDTPDHQEIAEATSTLIGCNEVLIPAWLTNTSSHRIEAISAKINLLKEKQKSIQTRLQDHNENQEIKEALASVRLLNWYLDNLRASSHDKKLCHVVGWTSAESANDLEKVLKAADIDAVVLFSEKPLALNPPVHAHHPWWIKPFTLFVNFVGTPGSHEIDPTPLLAFVVPLLFGYMFPDVGHGLVLLVVGLLISKRIPEARFLIPCGIAAIGFGVIFGDVFGQHDIIEPIWLKPFEDPLLVLTIPLFAGALLITTGLIFSGIQSHWRGELKRWLQIEAPVVLLYLVLILAIFWLDALWLLPPIILWYMLGTMTGCPNKAACLFSGLGILLESTLRLALNSLSFIRVGAFALAHSGTSYAANLIGDMIDNTFLTIIFFILSHTFIIVLEGLIVFVQTSRLILFEFFIRFLKAEGQVFRPLHGLDQ